MSFIREEDAPEFVIGVLIAVLIVILLVLI